MDIELVEQDPVCTDAEIRAAQVRADQHMQRSIHDYAVKDGLRVRYWSHRNTTALQPACPRLEFGGLR